jgi:ATP-dependent helicase/nuclease subunit A
MIEFTSEQLAVIDRRRGDLIVDANAGSGKTSVLVERFVRAVLEDGVEVGSILAITFTEKAAAELRDRIRTRLHGLGADDAAHATEGAFISTIHGFCARVLRANALAVGVDPAFAVIDESEAVGLADAAFDTALEDLAANVDGGMDLVASYGSGALRGAIGAAYDELRSRGQSAPALPLLRAPADLGPLRLVLSQAALTAASELGAAAQSAKVAEALERIGRCAALLDEPELWPGELSQLALPGGNGAALRTVACTDYADALERFRDAAEQLRAAEVLGLFDRLLGSYGAHYAALKRERSLVDFEDLELMTRDLLGSSRELRDRYAARFEQIMVDELQDTNPVQLELIESVARGNLFTVGDALQSIYGFRHADVELFERRREQLAVSGAHATLTMNFRSRREILDALNPAFSEVFGERFTPLLAGRTDSPAHDPRVELLVAEKDAQWGQDGLAAPWRLAEARALAARVRELIGSGAAARDVVVLTRATTDLRAYERALEDLGVPTYMIGGRGYWSHPQVVDLVAYLRALANPRDEEATYTLLASPLVGLSAGGLVLVAAAARESGRDPWWAIREPGEESALKDLEPDDRERLSAFSAWFAGERAAMARLGIEELIERVLELTGYDLAMLAMPGGERRLANVRKLMRLGREHEAARGRDLRAFLELARARADAWSTAFGGGASRESEAPVEGEALDAVRLMTIHRAKGLEFEIVCVADLGRGPRYRSDLLRLGPGGEIGLRLGRPGTGKAEPALAYRALGDARAAAEAAEERRLFYVAMTRARERLVLSGAVGMAGWPQESSGGPIAWIAPALVPDIASRLEAGERAAVVDREWEGSRARIAYSVVSPEAGPAEEAAGPEVEAAVAEASAEGDLGAAALSESPEGGRISDDIHPNSAHPPDASALTPAQDDMAVPVSRLSYSSLGEYARCGYRFYLERVLGLPRGPERGSVAGPPSGRTAGRLTGAERGVVVHALLERLDLRRPLRPGAELVATAAHQAAIAMPTEAETAELAELVERFGASELCARLAAATDVRREERFAFLLAPGGVLINGFLDVLAREGLGGAQLLVVDYKSDRLDGAEPAAVVEQQYATQRLVYALAALRSGARAVEVAHVFLERPELPVLARFERAHELELEGRLADLAHGVLAGDFLVTETPRRAICDGCPGEDGLCSWPLEQTRREAVDRLF